MPLDPGTTSARMPSPPRSAKAGWGRCNECEAQVGFSGADSVDSVVAWCFRHQLLLPRPYLVLTTPLRQDIQCQRGASVKIGCKYLDD